ncbi:pyridoxamine 5'-phosphate oxidase family protein [Halobellus ordinarius]|uniref:pyridoxamine 5'-phosphate oxidase family protein n=1 Tax=Halobellus ordinarius TaxID=3075120 RepID=UPI002880AB87|nr:pyridoxamine 5'-phosphate oxidase family protein [Halobellus sp. ZY16]
MSLEEYGVAMDDDEIARCLESMGVGTLAFGDERGGYAIPMSFGYDSVNDRCIFQFSFGEDSRKATYIEQDNRVSLSVFEWNSVTDWRSVVVQGTLEPVPEERNAKTAGIFAAHAKIASLEVFRRPYDELEFEWYELRIDEKQGRQSIQ